MVRLLHRWPGLIALALVGLLAISGAALSIFPAVERLTVSHAGAVSNVAELAMRIQSIYPGLEQIERSPSGRISAYWFDDGTPGSAVVDPVTGQAIGSADANPIERWLTTFHRSLFLDDMGHLVAAAGAAAVLLLSISGILLVARRTGGWRRWLSPLRGPLAGRIHVELARGAVLGLLLSSMTALWMTASTFALLPDEPTAPQQPVASGLTGATLAGLPLLVATSTQDLRELTFPYPDDSSDVFTLKTDTGTGYIDQGTGATLVWTDLNFWQRATEMVYKLHTGRGAALLGIVLGLAALTVPVMGATGAIVWFAGRRDRPSIRGNAPAASADIVILVGSESGATWGFAATLHKALTLVGKRVHVGPMSSFEPCRTKAARHYVVLTSTYGDGDMPTTAKGFLERLQALAAAPSAPLSILGFGDRSFPDFCGYAEAVADAARAKGWPTLLPLDLIDRQSPQAFARWGDAFGAALDIPLKLDHISVVPATTPLTLISRQDYGAEVQAPTAILRFAIPPTSFWSQFRSKALPRFEAGDLVGIVPEGSALPRFYSLASGSCDGFLEIVVRKHLGGMCSGALMALKPGQSIEAFLRRNPSFHAGSDRRPLILIGAGTGIGPLAGFIRANANQRPIHLFFGLRNRDSDFLYRDDLAKWKAEGRLADLFFATSREPHPRYVQHAIGAERDVIIEAIRAGARVMVCGGREMAVGVAETIAAILEPIDLSPTRLKLEGRYVEDVY